LPEAQYLTVDFLLENGANPLESIHPRQPSALGIAASELQPRMVCLMLQAARNLESAHLLAEGHSIPVTMACALASLITMSKSRTMIEGGPGWEQKVADILEVLVTKDVIECFPNTMPEVLKVDLVAFACRYNEFALKWIL
jgi:hypothetical protein